MSEERALHGPTRDTSPIPFEELSEERRAVIQGVNDRLREMHRDAQARRTTTSSPKPDYPWPLIIENRTNRNIVIDGQRGTGKTAILLTLLLGWQRDAQRTKDRGDVERKLFDSMGSLIRPLRLLDFNPLPEHLHPYTLFVQAFKLLIDVLETGRPRGNDSWAPIEDKSTIGEQWRQLHRTAELGWQTFRGARRDIDQHAFDSLEQDTEWIRLEERWRAFVDRLIEMLEERGMLPPGALLVLPVDDLDLHPDLSDDLLLALRKVWHPRVAVLLTGHVQHLKEAVQRKLMVRAFDASSRVQEPLVAELRALERLAEDLVQKVLPPRERLAAPLLSLADAWRLLHSPKDPIVALHEQHLAAGIAREDTTIIADWISVTLETWKTRLIRIRDAVQTTSSHPLDTLTELMQVCRDERGTPILVKHDGSRWRWSTLLPNQTFHVWTEYYGYTNGHFVTPDEPVNVAQNAIAETTGDHYCRIVTYQADEKNAHDTTRLFARPGISASAAISDISPLAPLPDLLSILFFLADHSNIDGVIREDSHASFAAPFRRTLKSNIELKLPIPTPRLMTSELEHQKLIRKWNERIPVSAKKDMDSTLWLWIWFILGEPLAGLDIEDRDDFLEGTRITPALWDGLLSLLAKEIRHPVRNEPVGLAKWARRAIPVLAAPEYGLSRETQQRLLDWRRGLSDERSWPSVCDELDRDRRAMLRRSVLFFSYITADQMARTGFPHDTSTPDGMVAAVEFEIRVEHADAPWWNKEGNQVAAVDTINLLALSVPPNRTIADVLYNANMGPSLEERIPLGRLFHINVVGGYRDTNWATLQASRLLRTASERARFMDRAMDLDRNTLSPADFMVQIWRLLAEIAGSLTKAEDAQKWAAWVTTETARALSYQGASLVVIPTARRHTVSYRFSAQSHDEWSFESDEGGLDPRERDHVSLLGWLLLCQSYPESSSGFARVDIRVPSILSFDGTALPQPRHEVWRTQEGIRHAWQRMCFLAERRHTATPEGQRLPQEEWLLASWLVMNFEAMIHGEPRTLLSYPLNLKELRQAMHSLPSLSAMTHYQNATNWLHSVKIVRKVFGPEIRPAWQAILKAHRAAISSANPDRSPSP